MAESDYMKAVINQILQKEKQAQREIETAKVQIDAIVGDILQLGLIADRLDGLRGAIQETNFSKNELVAAQLSLSNLAEELIAYRERL